jgi:benzoylsuccinyl-CoA thiolase BbsB subunit
MMREVAVLGIGQTKFGKYPDIRGEEMAREAISSALKDSGIPAKAIQVAYTARLRGALQAYSQKIMMQCGIAKVEMFNVENACAGGSTAVHGLWKDIAYGVYDVGIAVGVEDMVYPKGSGLGTEGRALAAGPDDLEAEMGMSMPSRFAMIARRQMDLYGATREDFAQVAVKSHKHASLNPYAQFQKEVTLGEVLASKMISDPITLYECCPISDGAAAIILCSMDVARKYTVKPIRIIGSALLSGDYTFLQEDITVASYAIETPRKAYEMAGVGPEDLNVIEIHDAFAPEEIIRYEDLGLCKRGEGIALLRSGATTLGGKVPVNASGGLISLGHPLSASGARAVVDVARQLRGQAGKMQVPDAKVGLAHMLGGVVTGLQGGACGIQILAR